MVLLGHIAPEVLRQAIEEGLNVGLGQLGLDRCIGLVLDQVPDFLHVALAHFDDAGPRVVEALLLLVVVQSSCALLEHSQVVSMIKEERQQLKTHELLFPLRCLSELLACLKPAATLHVVNGHEKAIRKKRSHDGINSHRKFLHPVQAEDTEGNVKLLRYVEVFLNVGQLEAELGIPCILPDTLFEQASRDVDSHDAADLHPTFWQVLVEEVAVEAVTAAEVNDGNRPLHPPVVLYDQIQQLGDELPDMLLLGDVVVSVGTTEVQSDDTLLSFQLKLVRGQNFGRRNLFLWKLGLWTVISIGLFVSTALHLFNLVCQYYKYI